MKITALIVTYNRIEKLKKTIEATLALPFQFIVIVNNASNDGTKEWLHKIEDKRVFVIDEEVNSGGAGGFKIGSKFICEKLITNWITFYDDDAWPFEDFIKNFTKISPQISHVYCSKVLDKKSACCKMNLPWKIRAETIAQNIKYVLDSQKFIINPQHEDNAITFSFVGVTISHEVLSKYWREIQDQLFIYYDDVFFSWYLSNHGVNIKYIPDLICHHDINQDGNDHMPAWKMYYLARNLILSKKIYSSNSFYSYPAIIFRLIKYSMAGLKHSKKNHYYQFLFNGVLDGLRNVSGKRH